MSGKMDMNVVSKSIDTVNNFSKMAANLSNMKVHDKPPVQVHKDENSTNQPHSQTVEVKVGNEQSQKPVIVHEKKETHIHKPFPDTRELNERECDVEKLRLQLEYDAKSKESDYKMKELEFRMHQEEVAREERREKEEYARRERERKREEDKKYFRRFLIGAGIIGTVGLGAAAYYIYTDSRKPSSHRVALPAPETCNGQAAEGSVK